MQKSFDGLAATTFLVFTAILGSIGFISLQGYSSDARNSKRASDIGSLQSALTVKFVEGQDILSFVDENKDNKIDSKILSLGGKASVTSDYYNAGYINYSSLSVNASDFTDPINESPYVVGVTTLGGGRYQIDTIMEQAEGKIARVIGTYVNREKKDVICSKVDLANNQVKIKPAFINMLRFDDSVIITTDKGKINTEITRVSADGLTIGLKDEVINPIKISLSNSESIGLIDRMDRDGSSGDNFVTDGGYNLPY